MWFILALLGYISLAIVFILDKKILTRTVSSPALYTFYSTIFMFGALLAWPLGVELLSGLDWLWAVISGLGFGFGLWTMFLAVKKGEASHVNPMIGGLITVATFIFAFFFLGEHLLPKQIAGMVFLVLSSFLLSFQKRGARFNLLPGIGWGLLAGILFAISHTSAKYLYDVYPFITGFVWTRFFIGLTGVCTVCIPSVWRALMSQAKTKKQKEKRRAGIVLVVITKLLGVAGVVLIQLAIALGSVTIVNALVGVQYALMFLFIYLLTLFLPSFFKEEFTKREIVVQSCAILLIVIGSIFFV